VWGPRFDHGIRDFNADGILKKFGILPTNPYYSLIYINVSNAIDTNVLDVATKLNASLKIEYANTMATMYEYANFGGYIAQMELALSNPDHVGIYVNKGSIQARFVDTSLLGDHQDLINIQKIVHPGGTFEGWVRLYNDWVAGRSTVYENIINKRISYMGMGAPFLELVECGNDRYRAYPINGPAGVLENFKSKYRSMMKSVYQSVINMVSDYLTAIPTKFGTQTLGFQGATYDGYSFRSKAGNIVFIESGTEKIVGNRLFGRGFILKGGVMQRFFGFIPR